MTNAEYFKQYRARLTAEGICSKCLVRKATEGKKTCAECSERKKQYYAANRDKCLEYNNQYRADNRDKVLEYNKQYNSIQRANDLCVIYAIWIAGFKYIGSTHAYEQRKVNHLSDLRLGKHKNKHLQALYNEHGPDALEFVVLATLEKETTELARRAIEQTFIDDTAPHLLLNVHAACRYCDAA